MNNKYILVISILLINIFFLCVTILPNLYLLGGIDFPNDLVGSAYKYGFGALIYGGWIVMPLISGLLVRVRDIGFLPILLLNSIPYVAQLGAFIIYTVLGEVYGYICC